MIRLSGQDHAFRHDGLILEKNWSSFDTLTEEQRACLRTYHGTHIRVHPDDYDQLAKFGLQLQTDEDGNPNHRVSLVDIAKPEKKSDNPKNDAKAKSDAKKEG